METLGVDPDGVAHRLDLLAALDRAREVELDVERNNVGPAAQSFEVPHGQHVVEPVHAGALAGQPIAEPLAGTVREDLILDPRRPVLADVACFGRKDDRRIALARQQHVRVAVHDHETRQVCHRALEPRVLGPTDDDRVDVVQVHRLADGGVSALDLGRAHHDRSNPLTSAQIARLCGVGTPCSSPKRTIPPLR